MGGVEAKRGAFPFAAAIGITNGQSGANAIKLFSPSLMKRQNKQESLSLASLVGLVNVLK